MILKNQNQSKMNLIDPDEAFRRDSVNKSAMSSFEVELAKSARRARANGQDNRQIAASMGVGVDTVEQLLAMQLPEQLERLERSAAIEEAFAPKEASNEPSDEKKAQDQYLSAAEAAYNELHGKTAKASALPALSDVVRKAIQPSRKDDWTETGGPNKQLRYHNSIWDSEVLERQANTKDNGEKIREENASIAAQRQSRRDEQCRVNWDTFKEILASSEIRKEASVQPLTNQEAYKYDNKVQKSGLSIFANTDLQDPFTHVAEKTDGEKMREERNTPKEKDRSWVKTASSKTGNNAFFDKMIDSMLDTKE